MSNNSRLGKCNPSTSCPKGGVKIHNTNNNVQNDPFEFYNNLKNQNKVSNFNLIYKVEQMDNYI